MTFIRTLSRITARMLRGNNLFDQFYRWILCSNLLLPEGKTRDMTMIETVTL